MIENVTIEVVEGDALAIKADVLALKYPQAYYGAHQLVAEWLESGATKARKVQGSLPKVVAATILLSTFTKPSPRCRFCLPQISPCRGISGFQFLSFQ